MHELASIRLKIVRTNEEKVLNENGKSLRTFTKLNKLKSPAHSSSTNTYARICAVAKDTEQLLIIYIG
jgi:hypothetical protein